jgi:hypothetical protein
MIGMSAFYKMSGSPPILVQDELCRFPFHRFANGLLDGIDQERNFVLNSKKSFGRW